jgi:hypothetical protein
MKKVEDEERCGLASLLDTFWACKHKTFSGYSGNSLRTFCALF